MSTVEVREIGRNWYVVSVCLLPQERCLVDERDMSLAGGKLRYGAEGSLTAKFHYNVSSHEGGEQMVRMLNFFAIDGEFARGGSRRMARKLFPRGGAEAPVARHLVEERVKQMCAQWCKNWQEEADRCLRLRLGRVQTLRRIADLAGDAVSEEDVRSFLERKLRERYGSDIFGATILWRMGWPDTRPAQAADTVSGDETDQSFNQTVAAS